MRGFWFPVSGFWFPVSGFHPSSSRTLLPPLIACAGGLLLAFHPVFFSGFGQVPGDLGDARLNHYVLEHSYRWLRGEPQHRSYWDLPYFHPQRNTGAYTDILMTVAPLYWFWRLLQLSADISYPCWLLTVFALNYAAAYWLFRRSAGLAPLAAAAGAYLLAFGSPRLAQIVHPQLQLYPFTLMAIVALCRLFAGAASSADARPAVQWQSRPAGWIIIFAGSCTAQLYAGYYLGWFLWLGLCVAGAWALVIPEYRQRLRLVLRSYPVTLAVVALISMAIIAPMAWHYLQASREVGLRQAKDIQPWLPMLQSWFYLGQGSWLYDLLGSWNPDVQGPGEMEHALGIGFVTPLLALLGLYRHRALPLVRILFFTAATLFLTVTIVVPGFAPWLYLYPWVPGAGAIRAVSRIGLLFLIPAGLGFGLLVQDLRSPWSMAIVFLICGFEQGHHLRTFDRQASRERIRLVAHQIDSDCPAFFLSPLARPGSDLKDWETQLDAMWAGLERGVPTANGYSGNFPPGWELAGNVIRFEDDAERIARALRHWREVHHLDEAELRWIQVVEPALEMRRRPDP